MPIKEKQTCTTHTKEKEESGICCQVGNEKEHAEQLTYEHTIKSLSIYELAQTNPTKSYKELEQMKREQNE